jgi:DNA-binding LacI/PurR family transcriptional regulator
MLIREEHIKPNLSFYSRLFLDALEEAGITAGSYNLPAWGYQPEGLHRCLDELFKFTPPTALITSETSIMIAARDHLTKCGLSSPRDVSLISLDQSPLYAWCSPQVSHFVWDVSSINRRVLRWAKRVAIGIDDKQQIFTSAKFVDCGTIGPAPKKEAKPTPGNQ